MTDPWSPRPAPADDVVAPVDAVAPVVADPPPAVAEERDELVVLDQLEADLSAVEQAIESLERVTAEGLGGDAAASRIAAAVSVERFGGASASAEVPGG
jgi:hypothetical protein